MALPGGGPKTTANASLAAIGHQPSLCELWLAGKRRRSLTAGLCVLVVNLAQFGIAPSRVRRHVDLAHGAAGEADRINEAKFEALAPGAKQRQAAPQRHRMHEEAVFID